MHAGSRSQFNHTTSGSAERGGLAVWLRLLAADRYRNSGGRRGPRPPGQAATTGVYSARDPRRRITLFTLQLQLEWRRLSSTSTCVLNSAAF
jgi:hypothetical protein